MLRRTLAVLGIATAVAFAQAPIVTTVLNSGSTSTRYDMVILGDGYQALEQARFNSDVNAFLAGLFAKTPYSGFTPWFNVHTVFRASADSGASQPDVTPPIVKNTAYSASYNTGGTARCLYIQNTSQALADAALAPANEGRVLVMVNDSRYGGCAGQFAVSYNGASMVEVQSHELGHSLAGLADEYDYPNNLYTGNEPTQVNITANSVGQKWSHWWGTESVSAFQGGGYYLQGLWRPRNDCLMRSLGVTLCPVCREQITKSASSIVNTIDAPQPSATTVTVSQPAVQAFSFTNLVPVANNPLITWKLDGVVVVGQNTSGFFLPTAGLSLGNHTLAVEVLDRSTQVRNDPGNLMRDSRTWTVTVTDPSAANLRIGSMLVAQQVLPGNAETDVTITVVNDGPAPANNISLECFLSVDTTVQTSDFYLGRSVIPTLLAGQQTTIVRRVRLPAAASPRLYSLLATLDREGAIMESSEADNTQLRSVLVQTGPCGPFLEYRDDLVYPRDQNSVSLTSGGTVLPTIVARCAAPGTLYLIAWGTSGTSPGLQLGPGLLLPLNFDASTSTSLELLNGPVFQSCFGALDGNGFANATIAWPAALPLIATPGHFAAVLLDPSLAIIGVTNAVAFDLQ
jgi:hypothetical protein